MHKLQIEEFKTALQNVWNAIGSDVLEMCENNTASKNEVIEMVLDANRINMYGDLPSDALLFWNGLSMKEQLKIADKAFIYKHYGY